MKDDYVGVLLEDIQDKLQRFAEAMADVPGDIREIKQRLERVEADLKVLKSLATNHEERLTTVEKTT